MSIQHNISLKKYNTFGVDAKAKRFISVSTLLEIQQLLKREKDLLIIGSGSNILLTKDIEKIVVHINLKGIFIDSENQNFIFLTVNAGENWHEFVLWCVSKNYGGVENLSLIPGSVGACPIQNIGAYGAEVKNVITQVNTIEIKTGKSVSFLNKECEFSYRNSIFKNWAKGKYIITSVGFKLTKNKHKINTSYGAIDKELKSKNIYNPTLKDISNIVISIRQLKLPNPKKIGNSGSFFKNPVILPEHFNKLLKKYPSMPHYLVSKNEIKIPAAWLIEQCGFKGKKFGSFGIHDKQALVIVNYGKATGKDIYNLAQLILKNVKQKFSIHLEIEVNIF
ncbi:MAG: UDP-N-acetylmuramate dehydrogenase [Tenacibaculum sp.]